MSTPAIRVPNERLYLYDDPELGVRGHKDADVVARHVERYERAIDAAEITGGVWLDFACGSGYGSEMISRVASRVFGVDRDLESVAYASIWHAGRGREFYQGDDSTCFNVLALQGLTANVVVSVETLEHMTQKRQLRWLDLVKRNLAVGGVLVLQCPIGESGPSLVNPWHLYEPTEIELFRILRERWGAVELQTDTYVSTAGVEAVQAIARCQ